MPTLNWIGKDAVINHHLEVPFRLLRDVPELGCGDPGSGNLIVEGDNLLALKALLPYYRGKVKCICIDPPYNTGNEGWAYNDNVNSPAIRQWIGETVGKEGETLDRHDRWLCMMYPRLALLREFLSEDGSIFIFLDDNEIQALRYLMDEIFGLKNFITTCIWQKVYSPKNSARHFSEDHDYVAVYAKNAETWKPNLVARSDEQDAAYKNRDNDPRGVWKTSDLSARNYFSKGTYSITCPSGRVIAGPPTGMYWRVSKEKFDELNADKRIWWGKDGNAIPQIKRFLTEVKQGVVPQTLWFYKDVGHTQDAKKELVSVMDFKDSDSVFITPKPTRLIERILQIATNPGDLVLDSFAGSGTTGHAVLKMNAALDCSSEDAAASRRFILVEMDEKIAPEITRERVKRVAEGYKNAKGDSVPGLGGGFRYVRLGDPLFDDHGRINEDKVRFADLARHVYFSETGEPLPKERISAKTPLLGIHHGRAVYLLYNGILKDKSVDGGNVLTSATLEHLPAHDGPKVVYAAGCRFSKARLDREGITFKQTPYAIRTR
ncbi:site-specific DNA-methyltransferase [Prosthecobacter fluviatilis]|uniref:site-specific DNA-methyltransferase (adenine-specific) n=1 Tax=Prosthecobacter fluviatilis TaxID=445931 RepID=A0ABW0KV15_9BACT